MMESWNTSIHSNTQCFDLSVVYRIYKRHKCNLTAYANNVWYNMIQNIHISDIQYKNKQCRKMLKYQGLSEKRSFCDVTSWLTITWTCSVSHLGLSVFSFSCALWFSCRSCSKFWASFLLSNWVSSRAFCKDSTFIMWMYTTLVCLKYLTYILSSVCLVYCFTLFPVMRVNFSRCSASALSFWISFIACSLTQTHKRFGRQYVLITYYKHSRQLSCSLVVTVWR